MKRTDKRPTTSLTPSLSRALGLAAWVVVIGWGVASLVSGGLRASFSTVRRAAVSRLAPPVGQPDAQRPWAGGYYNVLDALASQPLTRATTVAAVLDEAHQPQLTGAAAAPMYEANYRLYPTRVNVFFRKADGTLAPGWQKSAPEEVPRIPAAWQHEYVLWAAGPATPPRGYRQVYRSPEAWLFRAEAAR